MQSNFLVREEQGLQGLQHNSKAVDSILGFTAVNLRSEDRFANHMEPFMPRWLA